LEYGAVDFIAKPGGVISPGINKIGTELLNKVRLASTVPTSNLKLLSTQKAQYFKHSNQNTHKLVLIGASTGGPRAVTQILRALPADFPAAILLIQHMPKYFIGSFAHRLNEQCELEVKQAEDKDFIKPGRVLVAPSGFIMNITKYSNSLAKVHLSEDNLQKISPSIDLCFSSAAQAFESQVLGVILTGMGKDGTLGCLEIKRHGGKTIAEDESTCIVFGMPAAAIAAHAIDTIIPLDQIARTILAQVSK
jgi:two-component system chemotaxis response regulator CheB